MAPSSLTTNRDAFYDDQRKADLDMCHQAGKAAALACLGTFGHTDLREDLARCRCRVW
jgi:hypothetical protein